MLVASPSWAAMVQPGLGNLTINQGQGFKPVTTAVNANVGDSVMVGPGGSATVVYEDGCKIDVHPGAVTTIAPLSPCAAGSNAQTTADCRQFPDGWYWIDPRGVRHSCEPPDDWGWAIGAGLLAIGLGVGIYEATKSKGTTQPASP